MKFTRAVLQKNGLLKKLPNTDYWEVREEFLWYLDYETKAHKVEVEKGFQTNFGSIPRILQSIFSPTKYISYILHDKLYSDPNCEVYGFEKIKLSRWECDLILKEALRVEGAGIIERNLVYIGVRIGGFLFFNKS